MPTEPENYKFGGGAAETVLHPLVLALMLVVMVTLLVLPRRYMVTAFLAGVFLTPAGQQVLIGGVHVFVYRFIVIAGLSRMLRSTHKQRLVGGWNSIDTAFTISIVAHAIAFVILYQQSSAVVNQLGFVWDYVGGYVFLRYAIRGEEDVVQAVKCLAVLSVIFMATMVREQITGENIFGRLGGVLHISEVRGGRIRAQSAFQHPILAGTFGAIMLPLFVMLWKSTRSKVLAVIGCVSAFIMTISSACSTPVLTCASGIFAMCLWPIRKYMRWICWSVAGGIALLTVFMNAPVWFLIARVGAVEGSSGFHRAMLVDTFVRHIEDWWLLGTNANGAWGNMTFDTSNQYVNFGVTGGLLCLVGFIVTIALSFRRLGKVRRRVGRFELRAEWFFWLLNAALVANVVAFWGISYFDQTRVAWFLLLAMISAAAGESLAAKTGAAQHEQASVREPEVLNKGSLGLPAAPAGVTRAWGECGLGK
jgi:hypothetical protein